MKLKTFAAFVGPSVFMMLPFIAAPLPSVFIQSVQITQPVLPPSAAETPTTGFYPPTLTT